jgi:hypothetical protein
MLLRWAGPDAVDDVDWDSIRFRVGYERYRTVFQRLDMASPLGFTKAIADSCFENAGTLEELLDSLGAGDDEKRAEAKSAGTSASTSLAPIRYSWDRNNRTNKRQ